MSLRLLFRPLFVAATPLLCQTGPTPITADTGALPLLHRPALVYPREARARHVEGEVALDLTVNAEGLVTDARVISGPEELRKGALQAVLNWHYARPGAPTHLQARIQYAAPPAPVLTGAPSGLLARVEVDPGLSAPVREALAARFRAIEGRTMSADTSLQIADILDTVEPHAVMTFRRDEGGNTVVSIREENASRSAAFGTPSPGVKRIMVGGDVMAAKLLQKTPPEYPPLARQARIQGSVRLDVLIGNEGEVKNVVLISGHPILVTSAMEAVRQWVYQPTLLNGQAVEVQTQVDVNFTLLQ